MTKTVSVRLRVESDTSGADKYNDKMKETVRTTQEAKSAIQESTGAFKSMNDTLNTAVFGFSAIAVAKFGVELYQQGRAVNTAKAAFTAYVSKMGDANAILEKTRQATGNVVDDFTIMSSGAELAGLNIAKTSDDLTHMLSNVAKLASLRPDQTVADGMEAFMRIMRNGAKSIGLLDNIGLSSANVKRRIEEMGAALTDEKAFGAAVLAEMDDKLASLGDTATRGETAMNRLTTAAKNFFDTAAGNVAAGVEGTIGIIEYATGNNPVQRQAKAQAKDWWDAFTAELKADSANSQDIIMRMKLPQETVGTQLKNLYDIWLGLDADARTALENGFAETTLELGHYADVGKTAIHNLFAEMEDTQQAQAALTNIRNAFEDAGHVVDRVKAKAKDLYDVWALTQQADLLKASISDYHNNVPMQQLPPSYFTESWSKQRVDALVPQYLTQHQADIAAQAWETAKAKLEEYKGLLAEGLINKATYDGMQTIVDNAKKLADESQRAADNFAKMSLGELFGQGSGGRLGEWFDVILRDMGDSASQFTKDTFGLISGAQSDLSLVIRNQVNPMLENLAAADPKKAAQAIVKMENALEQADLLGYTMQQKIALVLGIMDEVAPKGKMPNTPSGNTFTIKAGMSASEAAAAAGMSVNELISTYGFKDSRHVIAGTYQLPDMSNLKPLENIDPSLMAALNQFTQSEFPNADPMAQGVTTAATESAKMPDLMSSADLHLQNMVAAMDKLTANVQEVRVKFSVYGTEQWLQELLMTKKIVVDAEFAPSPSAGGKGNNGKPANGAVSSTSGSIGMEITR